MKTNKLAGILLITSFVQFSAVASLPLAPAGPLDLWYTTQLDSQVKLTDIAFGNGLFVAVGNSIQTSTDGAHWTTCGPALGTADLDTVCYGAKGFVATGSANSTQLWFSPDGTNWIAAAPIIAQGATAPQVSSLAYGNGRYVASIYDASDFPTVEGFATSTNGTNWEFTPVEFDPYLSLRDPHSLAYGNGVFVLANLYTTTSADGVHWTTPQYIFDGVHKVIFGGGRFLASGDHIQLVSTDGINWTQSSGPCVQYAEAVGYGDGIFLGLTGNGVTRSTNGLDWLQQSALVPVGALAFGNGIFVATGSVWNGTDQSYNQVLMRAMAGIHVELAVNPQPRLTLSGLVPGTLRIEAKTSLDSLEPWSPLETWTLTNSPAVWTDHTGTAGTARFYRAVWNP